MLIFTSLISNTLKRRTWPLQYQQMRAVLDQRWKEYNTPNNKERLDHEAYLQEMRLLNCGKI